MQISEQSFIYATVVGIITFLILISLTVVLLVIYQRRMREKQRAIFQSIIDTEEEERSRIARDLHDELGPLLSVLKFKINHLKAEDLSKEDLLQHTLESEELLEVSIQEIRNISRNLLPGSLIAGGLRNALEDLCMNINAGSQVLMTVDYRIDLRLDKSQELNIYRIIREFINNTLKHAEAKNIRVSIRSVGKKVVIEAEDDGKGFDAERIGARQNKGIGLKNLESRANILSGTLKIQSSIGKGALVSIEFYPQKTAQ